MHTTSADQRVLPEALPADPFPWTIDAGARASAKRRPMPGSGMRKPARSQGILLPALPADSAAWTIDAGARTDLRSNGMQRRGMCGKALRPWILQATLPVPVSGYAAEKEGPGSPGRLGLASCEVRFRKAAFFFESSLSPTKEKS